jgi:Flp pilus assembly pilin Flp
VTDRIYRALMAFHPWAQRGQGLAEYALILALIAIIAIVALLFLGGQTSKILSSLGKSI